MRGTIALVVAVACVIAAGIARAPAASAGANPDACPTNKPMVVDVMDTALNIADLGADLHVWALDSYNESIQIWRTGTNAYCVKKHAEGSFNTFADVSPEGTGTVRADVTGTFEATVYLKIHGTFAPTVPTTGNIGTFDAQCTQDGDCPGGEPRVTSLYFSRVTAFNPGWFLASYDAGTCGTWTQTVSGDIGDITC
jgi:hypothetical protein